MYTSNSHSLVSVIMPAFNSGKFINESIESVLSQGHKDLELLVVDDGSTDETEEIVLAYAKRDSRVRFLRNQSVKGAAGARNTGMSSAKGRYVAFLDSDDLWLANKLEVQLAFMMKNAAVLSCSYYEMFDAQGRTKIITAGETVSYRDILKRCDVGCLTVIIDKEAVGADLAFPASPKEDYALWVELLRKGGVFHVCPQVLARYRKSSTSISGGKLRELSKQYSVLKRYGKQPTVKAIFYLGMYAANGIKKHRF